MFNTIHLHCLRNASTRVRPQIGREVEELVAAGLLEEDRRTLTARGQAVLEAVDLTALQTLNLAADTADSSGAARHAHRIGSEAFTNGARRAELESAWRGSPVLAHILAGYDVAARAHCAQLKLAELAAGSVS